MFYLCVRSLTPRYLVFPLRHLVLTRERSPRLLAASTMSLGTVRMYLLSGDGLGDFFGTLGASRILLRLLAKLDFSVGRGGRDTWVDVEVCSGGAALSDTMCMRWMVGDAAEPTSSCENGLLRSFFIETVVSTGFLGELDRDDILLKSIASSSLRLKGE